MRRFMIAVSVVFVLGVLSGCGSSSKQVSQGSQVSNSNSAVTEDMKSYMKVLKPLVEEYVKIQNDYNDIHDQLQASKISDQEAMSKFESLSDQITKLDDKVLATTPPQQVKESVNLLHKSLIDYGNVFLDIEAAESQNDSSKVADANNSLAKSNDEYQQFSDELNKVYGVGQ